MASNSRSGTRPGAVRRGASARVLRIIGGVWRGRKLRFAASAAIRPTPDRVRETLFNWLARAIPGARCLDLFAGSGALGLEALSRGAAHVTFIEQDVAAVAELRTRVREWQSGDARVLRTDALRYLRDEPPLRFDIVFLDPPFAAGLLGSAAQLLERRAWLAPQALIYAENAADEGLPGLPEGWQELKSKRAGEVGYHLFRHSAASHPA